MRLRTGTPCDDPHLPWQLSTRSVASAGPFNSWRVEFIALEKGPQRRAAAPCFLLHVSGDDFLRYLWTVFVCALALVKHNRVSGSGSGRTGRSGSVHRSRDASVRPP